MKDISANRSAKRDSQPSGLLKATKNSYMELTGSVLVELLTRRDTCQVRKTSESTYHERSLEVSSFYYFYLSTECMERLLQ